MLLFQIFRVDMRVQNKYSLNICINLCLLLIISHGQKVQYIVYVVIKYY
uniref:Uncharacterized protein n=1 Tax=Podoviridae sp. ctZkC8 TaxID=2825259 RepID=A0A8S5UC57_9CAUD|nr:MAG TPA: hypothetical protein [Podoviridae sp. ctZkC8]